MMLLYAAQPIDRSVPGPHDVLYENLLAEILQDQHAVVYRPRGAFQGKFASPDRRVEVINRAALDEADLLIAYLPADSTTLGVPREIESFAASGRPWAAFTDITRSFAIQDASCIAPLSAEGHKEILEWVRRTPCLPQTQDASVPLLFCKDQNNGDLPSRNYPGDAGFDLYAAADVMIPIGQFRDIPCGVRIALPEGLWARIVGRSSTLRKRGLMVSEGTIDTGWRGPLFAGAWNLGDQAEKVCRGERVAQLILLPNLAPSFNPVWASAAQFQQIPHDGRGSNGFGSSGS